jgi:hypothetical protein
MRPTLQRLTLSALVAGSLVASGLATAQDDRSSGKKGGAQRASGVITLTESNGKAQPKRVHLSIKTDAVWRDFVRDQATAGAKPSTKAAAEKGKDSIATKGEPASPNDLLRVEVVPDTRLESRFRAGNDESNSGYATEAEALAAEKGEKPKSTEGARRRESAKPKRLAPADLKAGLFVEVEYRQARDRKQATVVRVIRPVGGPESPAGADAKPEK